MPGEPCVHPANGCSMARTEESVAALLALVHSYSTRCDLGKTSWLKQYLNCLAADDESGVTTPCTSVQAVLVSVYWGEKMGVTN